MLSVSRSLTKESPSLMGVINLTADSFSDGGNLLSGNLVNVSKTLRKVEKLINEGADILDFGAESTRPGFTEIPSQIQIDRLIPILEQIKDEDILISVDSRDYKVLREASKFGMKFVNDVSKNISPKKLKLVKEKELFICTTHQGNIKQKSSNILADVDNFFDSKEKLYLSKGINIEKCFFDPGFGYGKTPLENILIMSNIRFFKKEKRKILTGTSRKKSFADFFKDTSKTKLSASLLSGIICALGGSDIIRSHEIGSLREELERLGIYEE